MRSAITFLMALFVCAAAAQQQPQPVVRHASSVDQEALNIGERDSVISALTLSFGQPLDKKTPAFVIAQDFILTPSFTSDGLLIEFAIEPKNKGIPYRQNDPRQQMQRSPAEFDMLLWKINFIKALGQLEEEDPNHIVVGVRGNNKRYQNAYLMTAEFLGPPHVPPPIYLAHVYYLHQVTGVPSIRADFRPEDADSFILLCVDGKSYLAPKSEYLEILSMRNQSQTLNLAGPTGDNVCGD
jgi:hypothetical protein